jgi:hypothetical protein
MPPTEPRKAPDMRADQAMGLDVNRAHPARIYNYLLGGKDNFKADRDAADELAAELPSLPVTARANRAFLVRVVRYLAAVRGIRQFLDVGTGLPAAPNLHEVAQGIAPAAKIVYVDNDPLVLVHARALLTSTPQGATHYLDADLHDPTRIIEQARRVLDLGQPVAVTLLAILHLFGDDAEVRLILKALTGPLCGSSAVAVSVATADSDPDGAKAAQQVAGKHGLSVTLRSRAQVAGMLAGLDLLDPGVTLVHRWRPHPDDPPLADADIHLWGAVGLKPDPQAIGGRG